MLVADILRKKGADVETVKADISLKQAIQLLSERRIGALLVSQDGRTVDGILSERDIVRELAREDLDLAKRPVSDLMVKTVHTCRPDATVSQVMALMDAKRIRHVPVVAEGSGLAGIVSIGDVVNALLQEAESERKQMADYISDRVPH